MNNKLFIDQGGLIEQIFLDSGKRKYTRFPVCLALKCKEAVSEVCPDFVLSTDKKKVLVRTDSPLPKGSRVLMHFYIPPESKLLGVFEGRVTGGWGEKSLDQMGMQITFINYKEFQIRRLQNYLEEKKRLVDLIM
jgi:hypothetical protein